MGTKEKVKKRALRGRGKRKEGARRCWRGRIKPKFSHFDATENHTICVRRKGAHEKKKSQKAGRGKEGKQNYEHSGRNAERGKWVALTRYDSPRLRPKNNTAQY